LIEETMKQIKEQGVDTVYLLATPITIKTKLYENELDRLGINVTIPTYQQQLNIERVIRKVIAGSETSYDKKNIIKQVAHCKNVLLGCTELSVLMNNEPGYIDPLNIVVNKVFERL
jgi:aspartate/glutamate racemase